MDLEANQQVIKNQIEDNFQNGEEYVGLIETPYQNQMLDRRVLKIEERPMGHMLILPQEVVREDVWTRGLQSRHSFR